VIGLFGVACGDGNECISDLECGDRERCVRGAGTGECQACDAEEIPYDGIDNDCRIATRDRDLDGDGDNWVDAPIGPGTDCDDDDPTVSGRMAEVCGDGIDNNCNSEIDEPACADTEAPNVEFLTPEERAPVVGTTRVSAQISDDVGIVSFRLFLEAQTGAVELASESLNSVTDQVVEVNFDTAQFPDGNVTLRAEVQDVVGVLASARRVIAIDNVSGPRITWISPMGGAPHGGLLPLEAAIRDASGIAEIRLYVDGLQVDVANEDRETYTYDLDTRGLDESVEHEVELVATDGLGNESRLSVDFRVDNTPPALSFVTPPEGARVNGVLTVTLLADDPALAEVRFLGESSPGARPEFSLDTRAFPNGPLTLTATAVDAAIIDGQAVGNMTVVDRTVEVINAEDGPIVSFVTPTSGDVVFGTTPIEVEVLTEPGRDLDEVRFSVNGQSVASLSSPPWATEYAFSREGLHQVVATATDDAMATASATVTVQVTSPATLRFSPTYPVPGIVETDRNQIAAGDIDGDGVGDVVVTGQIPRVIFGTLDANGSWIPGQSVVLTSAMGSDASSGIELYDMNDDGQLDVVAASYASISVWLQGSARRSFLPALRYAVPPAMGPMTEIAVADFDDDGNPDVVVGGKDTVATVFFGDAAGQLDTTSPSRRFELLGVAEVTDLEAYDINRDGFVDIGVGRARGSVAFTVFLNSNRRGGAPLFGAGVDTPTDGTPIHVAFGDLNDDGITDAVTVEAVSGLGDHVVTFLGVAQPAGAFSAADFGWIQEGVSGLALEKVPGTEEIRRIYVGTRNMNGFEVWSHVEGRSLNHESAWLTARRATFPTIFDMDGDGDQDVTMLGAQDGVFSYSKALGNDDFFAGYVRPISDESGLLTGVSSVVTGDLFGDDEPEFIAGARVYEVSGGRLERRPNERIETEVFAAAAIGDIDGVNGPDIAYASGSFLRVMLSDPSDPTGFTASATIAESPTSVVAVAIADIDLDGVNEMAFIDDINQFAGRALIYQLDTSGTDPTAVLEYTRGLGEDPIHVFVADMDGDGDRDFGVTNRTTGDIAVIGAMSNGVAPSVLYNVVAALEWAAVDNFGASPDALPDIVGVSQPRGLAFLQGDANTGFRLPRFYEPGLEDPLVVDSGDYNGDQVVDCLVVNNSAQVAILAGRGTGAAPDFFPGLVFPTAGRSKFLESLDINGDGDEDVFLMAENTAAIIVFFSDADEFVGP
jgi:hypothetical protein